MDTSLALSMTRHLSLLQGLCRFKPLQKATKRVLGCEKIHKNLKLFQKICKFLPEFWAKFRQMRAILSAQELRLTLTKCLGLGLNLG